MPTDNEWLRLVYAQLQQNGGGVAVNPNAPVSSRETWRSMAITSSTAAGNGFDYTVPVNTEWQIQQLTGKLVTNATAANRFVIAQVLDASVGATTIGFASSLTQAASLTYFWCFGSRSDSAALLSLGSQGSLVSVAMSPLILSAGDKLRITPGNFQTGDLLTPYLKVMSRDVS
jgi:hypothetical protein